GEARPKSAADRLRRFPREVRAAPERGLLERAAELLEHAARRTRTDRLDELARPVKAELEHRHVPHLAGGAGQVVGMTRTPRPGVLVVRLRARAPGAVAKRGIFGGLRTVQALRGVLRARWLARRHRFARDDLGDHRLEHVRVDELLTLNESPTDAGRE